jgi:hypothetical protein
MLVMIKIVVAGEIAMKEDLLRLVWLIHPSFAVESLLLQTELKIHIPLAA